MERFTAVQRDLLFGNTDAHGYRKSLGSSSTESPWQSKARRSGWCGPYWQINTAGILAWLFALFPLRPGDTISVAGDTDRYLLNAAAMLKESFDLLADAHMGFLGRAGVRLGHVGPRL